MPESIPVSDIVLDREFYPRVNDDWQTVAKYVDAYRADAKFPPIVVVWDRERKKYIVLDGWHRIQAVQRLKRETILADVRKGLLRKKWLPLALEMNIKNGRCLTTQDRTMIANRLMKAGYDLKGAAKLVCTTTETLNRWLISRVTDDGTIIKSAVLPAAGTANQSNAIKHSGSIANANVRRTLDEMLAILRGNLIDVSVEAQKERAIEIHESLGELLGAVAV